MHPFIGLDGSDSLLRHDTGVIGVVQTINVRNFLILDSLELLLEVLVGHDLVVAAQ